MPVRSILIAMVLALFAGFCAQAQAQDNENWQIMFQRNYEELQYQVSYVDKLTQDMPATVAKTRQSAAELRKKLDELMMFSQSGGKNPMQIRAVLAGLGILSAQAEAVAQPLEKNQDVLKRFQDRLAELDKEFSQQAAEGPAPDVASALGDYLKQLRQLRGRVARVGSALDQGLSPIHDLMNGLGHSQDDLTARLPRAWHDYYLVGGRGLVSPQAWLDAWRRLGRLQGQARTYAALLQTGQVQPLDVLVKLSALWVALMGACWLGLRRVYGKYPWDGPRSRPLAPLAWICLGGALIWAASGQGLLLVNAEVSALAQIFISRGGLGLSWFLRRLERGDKAPDRNPVDVAWRLFTLGVVLQLPWLPEVTRAALWTAGLGLGWYWIKGRNHDQGRDLVLALAKAGVWVFPLLAVPAILGWANLSMLLAMAWFLLLLFFQAGLALHGLAIRWAGPPGRVDPDSPWSGLGAHLVLPVTINLMAGLFLFWVSLSMGGSSVFVGIVGYKMGGDGFTLDLARLGLILVGFYLARAGTGFVDALLARLPATYPDLERGVVNLLETCSTYVVWGLFALACLQLAGASFTSLAVVAGGLSVGIGFGLQQVINNFISGLILLFGRSIQAGDTLQIGDTWGVVQRVNVRDTVVRTFDNAALLVPNSELITQKIINWSHRDRKVRRAVDVPVAFGQDPALVQEILIKAASAHPNVLKEPRPSVLLADFKDTGFLLYRLMIWVNDVNNALRTCSDVRLAVDRDLRERGLAIAGSPPQAPVTP